MKTRTRHHRRHTAAFGLRISKAGALYIVITLLLGFSAVNTGNNLLFLVVSGLLAFMSVTGLTGMLNIKRLTPELLPPEELFAGVPATFRLRVRNAKRYLPAFLVRLECIGGPGVTIPLVPRSGAAEGNVTLTFPRRGWAAVDAITVSSPFPVNFFTRWWTFHLEERFVVFPHLGRGPATGDGRERQHPGSTTRLSRGLEGELERISDYSGAEPLRMIHWKLSARSDELLVKEFGRAAAQPLVIDLDALPGGVEERLSRAAGLVRRWSGERPVGLKLRDRAIPAEAGHRHELHLLTELALYDVA